MHTSQTHDAWFRWRWLLIPLLLTFIPHPIAYGADTFVRQNGTQLTLNGQLFRFSGPNMYWLGLDENVGGVDYPSLYRVNNGLDTVVAMGGTVVRAHTLGVSVGCTTCLMPTRGQWNAEAWKHADYAVYAAGQRNLKLIIPLTDQYAYYHGGYTTFTVWRGKDAGAFWTDPQIIGDFTQYVGTILNHVNPYTGLRYRDDPTILAWETGNELNAPRAWTAIIAHYLKHLDPNHLVIDGNYGLNANSVTIPDIDIVSDHFYPMDVAKLQRDVQQAQQAGKAFYAGEFAWNQGDLTGFLTALAHSSAVGSSYWSLLPHTDDGVGFVAHQDGYTLHYPGDTSAMHAAVRQLSAYAYGLRERSMPTLPRVTTDLHPLWPSIVSTAASDPAPVWVPTGTGSGVPTPIVPVGTFVTGINLGGGAVTINGQRWLSLADAQARGMQITGGKTDQKSLTPTPSTDNDTRTMLNSIVYAPEGNLGIQLPLANGTYQVYVWAMENYASNTRSWNLNLEGQTVGRELGLLPLNTWTNYGPYAATVQDGILNLDLVKGSGGPMISGLAVYTTNATLPTMIVPTSVPTTSLPTASPPTRVPTTVPTTAPTSVPTTAPTTAPTSGTGTGLTATYYMGSTMQQVQSQRIDPQINFDWGQLGSQGFAARWQAQLAPQWSEAYQIGVVADDGIRVWLNNQIIIDDWSDHGARERWSQALTLTAGQRDDLRVEYYQHTGNAVAKLMWRSTHTPSAIIPTAHLYPVASTPVSTTTTAPTTVSTSVPTRTPTTVSTIVPTSAPPATSAVLRVDTRAQDLNPTDPFIKPWLRLTNTGTTPIDLSTITVRYWYTADGGQTAGEDYVCDYAQVGSWNVRGRIVRMGTPTATADSYLEVRFAPGAGRLAPGQTTEIQQRLNQRSWKPYNEANDYSYGASSAWTTRTTITAYQGDTLISGRAPTNAR